MTEPLDFFVAVEDFDRELLPPEARQVGSDRFTRAVTAYYRRQFAPLGGTTAVDVDGQNIHVNWTPDAASGDPFGHALALLQRGELDKAIPLMETLLAADADDADLLYNLGMAYSDTGRLDEAILRLSASAQLQPRNANALVALGVAYQRRGDATGALETLERAAALDPGNPYARRNLGGVLASLDRFGEAEPHLREAARLAPDDQQAVYGLAFCLEQLGGEGQLEEADALYQRTIDIDPTSQVAEIARRARSALARRSFRAPMGGGVRMDAVMYCLDALQKFASMAPEQVQAVAFEVATLGRGGLDTNDPTPKYRLRSLPGDFTGLHLVSIMYVGFKRIAPDLDAGFDLSREYAAAQQLFSGRNDG